MVLITGSKSENPKLTDLVGKQYRDLSKYRKNDEIESMKSWMNKQLHLPKLTDDQILVFLHACNYSIEKAKETVDSYYTIRTRGSQVFTERSPQKKLARAFEIAYFICMPESSKTFNDNQILILKLRNTDPSKANFVEGVKTTFALTDLFAGKFPLCEGVEIIMDMEGLVLGHLAKIDFSALKVFMAFCQEAFPFRLKAIHVINAFPLINQIMAILKPFLKVELLKKISFYTPNEFNILTSKHIPLESLPSDYGGTVDCLEKLNDENFRQMEIAGDWLEELEGYKVNDSKRLGKRRSDLDFCDGSFKKLELD